jgi:hypothetical protein
MKENTNRRQFLGTTAIAGAGLTLSLSSPARARNAGTGADSKPGLLGGQPVRTRPDHNWPVCNAGYGRLNKEAFIKHSLASRSWQRLFPAETLAKWEERTECPANDKLAEEAAWFTQTTLLGTHSDMDQMAEAIRKVQKHAGDLAKA